MHVSCGAGGLLVQNMSPRALLNHLTRFDIRQTHTPARHYIQKSLTIVQNLLLTQ
jgi:hypothetical protein